jgi:hypothetical protein
MGNGDRLSTSRVNGESESLLPERAIRAVQETAPTHNVDESGEAFAHTPRCNTRRNEFKY